MSPDVVICRPNDALPDVERLMRSHQIRRIPVVDSGQHLVGILSLADIARATTQQPFNNISDDLSSEGLASTLADICAQNAPRSVHLRA
jgi:CBS-domain-containing membrane protein